MSLVFGMVCIVGCWVALGTREQITFSLVMRRLAKIGLVVLASPVLGLTAIGIAAAVTIEVGYLTMTTPFAITNWFFRSPTERDPEFRGLFSLAPEIAQRIGMTSTYPRHPALDAWEWASTTPVVDSEADGRLSLEMVYSKEPRLLTTEESITHDAGISGM